MTDLTIKRLDELESSNGWLYRAGDALGVGSFRLMVEQFAPDSESHTEHDHATEGREEVYVVLSGDATLHVDGEIFELKPGTLARVGPAARRRVLPGPQGVTLLALGGTPGKAYSA